ncbi:extracellular solute-binding protein, partial [Cutibacterium acnes]
TSLYTTEKVVPEGTISYTISKDLEPMFSNNKLAMFAGGTNNLDNFMSRGDVDFGVIGMPEKFNLGGGYAFAVPREAKQPDAAVEFAKWFVQPEVLSEIAIRQPSRMSAATVPPWNTPEYQIVFDSAPYSKALPVIPEWGEIMSYMIRVLQLALQEEVTPQQAADDIT